MRTILIMIVGMLAATEVAAADNAKTTPAKNIEQPAFKTTAEAAATPVVVTSLPENVKLIVGIGKTRNYFERVRAIHALGTNELLSRHETSCSFITVF